MEAAAVGTILEITGEGFQQGATRFEHGMTGEILNSNNAGDLFIAFRPPHQALGAQWISKQRLVNFCPVGGAPRKPPNDSEASQPSYSELHQAVQAKLAQTVVEQERTIDAQRDRINSLQMANQALHAEVLQLQREVDSCRRSKDSLNDVCEASTTEPGNAHDSIGRPGQDLFSRSHRPCQQANPPVWPSSVHIFGPDDSSSTIQSVVMAAFSQNGGRVPEDNHGHFSDARFVFLFKPGTYANDIPVGYYTQVVGLGRHPSDVVFSGSKGVYCEAGSYHSSKGALDTFWRGAENFKTLATWSRPEGSGMLWAVSQASFLRRIEIPNDLSLYQYEKVAYPGGPIQTKAGFASGGYFADMKIEGSVNFGSQQQWFTRNSKIVSIGSGGVWNIVYGGVDGAPTPHFSNVDGVPNTVLDDLPVTSSKPYITIAANGKYALIIPAVQTNSRGPQKSSANDRIVDFSDVYVTDPSDSATTINRKLAHGLHVVLSPGNYCLDEPLLLETEGQVLLGLGLATLITTKGNPAIRVGDVDAIRIAGVMVQAGPADQNTDVLVQIGIGSHKGHPDNPTFLHDLFVRVGGPNGGPGDEQVSAKVMLRINSGHVVGDNIWLWRADHTRSGLVRAEHAQCEHALQVYGNDVLMYGLAAEHTQKDQVQWSGEHGRTYFFQCELPYEPDDADGAWATGRSVGYRVMDSVRYHEAWGCGVYSYFRDHPVTAHTAISCPRELERRFHNSVTVKLNGYGCIANVINNNVGIPGSSDNHDESVYGSGPVNYVQ